ncbi:MAG: homogentisate phytyltransferase [Bacteroidia bacterium]|nr:homogentisate phytyltransferase [Bacteroidia bacterium]
MRFLATLWQFSRPHTLIGSTVSLVALFAIAVHDIPTLRGVLTLLLPSLISAWGCNIYITGLNQWSDVDVDRINKPWLPIPAGRLTRAQALVIVIVSGIISLGTAAMLSPAFFGLILLIVLIGTAYSLPPLKFKRNHIAAASAITLVRGLLVNAGFYVHFRYELTGAIELHQAMWPLIVFVAAFSLGIAWFKDIPDTAGDAEYQFGTLAVQAGRGRAFLYGVIVVSAAYLYVCWAGWAGYLPRPAYMISVHLLCLGLFWWQASRLQVKQDGAVKRFYLFFWGLFFAEYLLYPIAFYL